MGLEKLSRRGYAPNDLYDLLQKTLGNVNLAAASLAVGATASNFSYGVGHYMVDGFHYAGAAGADVPYTAGHTSLGNSQSALVAVTKDALDAVTTYQGRIVSGAAAPPVPAIPAGQTVLGYIRVTTNGAGTFVYGTTLHTDGNVTTTYLDLVGPSLREHTVQEELLV